MTGKSKKLDDAAMEAMQSDLAGSAFFQTTSTQVDKPTSGQTAKPAKPHVDKYTTHLPPELIEAVKNYAFFHKMKDYEVVKAALIDYLEQHKDE